MVCEECCQINTKDVNCYCVTGKIGVKYIGLVKGCVYFSENLRCKTQCGDTGICDRHINAISESDKVFLKKLF